VLFFRPPNAARSFCSIAAPSKSPLTPMIMPFGITVFSWNCSRSATVIAITPASSGIRP
jgi:hypothetical protein